MLNELVTKREVLWYVIGAITPSCRDYRGTQLKPKAELPCTEILSKLPCVPASGLHLVGRSPRRVSKSVLAPVLLLLLICQNPKSKIIQVNFGFHSAAILQHSVRSK